MKEKINDFLVWCRLKQRTGLIKEANPNGFSLMEGGNVSFSMDVTKIDYVYKWIRPFKKITNAVKRTVPFHKET